MTQPHYIDRGLLPCPFCGEAASALQSVRVDTYGDWIAGCDNEQCNPQPETVSSTREAAIAAWNRRAPLPMEAVAWRWEDTMPGRGAKKIWRVVADLNSLANLRDAGIEVEALAVIPTQGADQ